MRPIDYGKALGLGVALLALNLLITTAVITIYALLVEPGQAQAHYNAMAPRIGAWSGPIGGILLMFGAGYLFGRRRPERNALAFIAVAFAAYLVVDAVLGLAAAPADQLFRLPFVLSVTGAGVSGLAGAALSRRR